MQLNTAEPFVFYPGGHPTLLIQEALVAKHWRPTVVFFGQNQGQLLGIEQWRFRRGKDHLCLELELHPSFVKGGVDFGEEPEAAVYRETAEEVGIGRDNLANVLFIGYMLVAYGKRDRVRDGFTKGKLWLVYVGDVLNRESARPNKRHAVKSILWVNDPRELLHTREEKTSRKREAFSAPAFLELVGVRTEGGG